MLNCLFMTLVVLAVFAEATKTKEEHIRKFGWDEDGLSNMTNLKVSPNEAIQEMVEVVEEQVRKLLQSVKISSTLKRFKAIKYRSQSSVDGINFFVMVDIGKCVSRVILRMFENSVGESVELTGLKIHCVNEEDPIEYFEGNLEEWYKPTAQKSKEMATDKTEEEE